MFSLFKTLLQQGIELLSGFFSGSLPIIFYYWCLVLLLLVIFQVIREKKAGIEKSSYLNRAILEFLLFFLLWTVGIVLSEFITDIIPNGVLSPQKYTFTYIGLIPITSLYLSAILVLSLRNFRLKEDSIRLTAFLTGFITAFIQFKAIDKYILHTEKLSLSYLITLSILAGITALLLRLAYKISFED
ncbi:MULTISPECIES: DUF5823 family protein [Paenibacillus]|uniref:DUF5823 family protein n=1 Tax=Paenibacillus TaxID=44249 RepID=UPI002FE281EC